MEKAVVVDYTITVGMESTVNIAWEETERKKLGQSTANVKCLKPEK